MDTMRFRAFMDAMVAELQLLTDLMALEQKKTDVLVQGQAADLDVLVKGEQVLVWQLGRAEERRQRLALDLAVLLEVPRVDLTMGRLVEMAPAELREDFADLHDQYAAAVAGLARLNEQNCQLIQGALAYVEFALSTLQAASPPGTLYTAEGQREGGRPGAPRARLDGRA